MLIVSIPYLNSHKDHKDAIDLKIVCDGLLDPLDISGRGEGWSVKYKDRFQESRRRRMITSVVQVICGVLILIYMPIVKMYFPNLSGFSQEAVLVYIWPLLLLLILLIFQFIQLYHSISRLRRRVKLEVE